MVSNSDLFIKAITAPPSKLASPVSATSSTINLESTDGLQSDTAIIAIIDRVNEEGALTSDLMEVVIGTIGANGLENVVRGVGGIKQPHKAGAIIEFSVAAAEQWNRLVEGILKTHDQKGNIKPQSITKAMLTEDSVDGNKIADGSVKLNHLDKSSFSTANTGYIFNDVAYNSSEYGDLAGSIGPLVKVNVPSSGSVLVLISCGCYGTGVGAKMVSFVASGANTIIVNDDEAARNDGISAAIVSSHTILKNLNPGETTFTLKYKGLNSRFFARKITVIPLI